MSQTNPKRKSKPRTYMMRVISGGFEPADSYTNLKLRERKYALGELVCCTFKKLNNPKFNALVHWIGVLCTRHIETFHGMDAHQVLKRLQIEGNIHCEQVGVVLQGMAVEYRYPMSLDFETVDDGERHEIARKFCRLIASRYWAGMEPEKIEEMAASFIEEV